MVASSIKGKLSIELYDDIINIYVDIISTNPFIIKSNRLDSMILLNLVKLSLQYDFEGYNNIAEVESFNFNNKNLELNIKTVQRNKIDAEKLFFVDYKDECTLAVIESEDIVKYRNIASKINKIEMNNLGMKLEKVLLTDEIENEKIYRYLIEINNKLDELLTYLRPKVEIESSFIAKVISISADSFYIFSDRLIDISKQIFFYATLLESSKQVRFAAVSKAEVFRINSDSSAIYRLKFIDLEDEIKDNIMRFIFNIDRANLKRISRQI